MSLTTQVSNLATRVGTEFKSVRASIGSLSSLSTTEKGSIVGAINEVQSSLGGGGDITADQITDSTSVGRSVIRASTAALARAAIGAGTGNSDLALGTTSSTALRGDYVPTWSSVTGKPAVIAAGATAADARTAIGAQSEVDVENKIAALVDSAPAALDTLSELADALGNDPNFATSMTTALGNRVRVDATQSFSSAEKGKARDNIDVYGKSDIGDPTTNFVTTFEAALV